MLTVRRILILLTSLYGLVGEVSRTPGEFGYDEGAGLKLILPGVMQNKHDLYEILTALESGSFFGDGIALVTVHCAQSVNLL
jgi:hypothetical protein